jgi:uncharacterized protein YggE
MLAICLGLGLAGVGGALAAVGVLDRPGGSDDRGIAVSGEATVSVPPDLAEVTLGVEADGPTAAEAQRRTARTMEKVLAALAAAGVERKDLRTTQYSLTPVRRWDEPTRREVLLGYRAANLVTVRTGETGRVGQLVDAAVSAGATDVANLSFSVADRSKVREEALARAVADARHQAERLARAAGVRLGRVQTITDSTAEAQPLSTWARLKEAGAAADGAPPLEPGRLRFTTRVQVTFGLR